MTYQGLLYGTIFNTTLLYVSCGADIRFVLSGYLGHAGEQAFPLIFLEGIGWVPKKFELTENYLDFAEGMIPLTQVEDVVVLSSEERREFSVRLPGRNYLIRATTPSQAVQWVNAISENVKAARASDPEFLKSALVSKSTTVVNGRDTDTDCSDSRMTVQLPDLETDKDASAYFLE